MSCTGCGDGCCNPPAEDKSETLNDLVLLHGRHDRDQEMKDWGFNGPVLRNVAWVHWTYGTMNVAFTSRAAAEAAAEQTGWHWFDEHVLEMTVDEDMVVIRPNFGRDDPQYFGDFELQSGSYRKVKP